MTDLVDPQAMAKIGAIWAEVLGVETVGSTDNFFELGGDSIMITIMVMQVEQTADQLIRADLVFEAPTLEEFTRAAQMEAKR